MISFKTDDWYTITNYAKRYSVSRPTIYQRIKDKKVETLTIDGVTFVKSR